jgi:ferredoxin-NADP reductase/predicted pyridoxine 5'-phosphate oxidase superfamily flavin-nucleotide-binding protein
MTRSNAFSNDNSSPFHKGELDVQGRVGARDMLAYWGSKAIRPFFLEQHQTFFSQLPFIVVSACDVQGLPWVTLLVGQTGFIHSPDSTHLHFATRLFKGDALEHAFIEGADIGLIGIELENRRRNRANGSLSKIDSTGMTFSVSQSFGNCPQYITERAWHYKKVDDQQITVTHHSRLTQTMQKQIAEADTLFLASGYSTQESPEKRQGEKRKNQASFGMDASHRGGPAGFVKVVNDRQLVIPDYAGNNFFNTIGNLVMNPLIGLLFIDFDTDSLLQLSGRATIDWDSEKVREHQGALRLLNIEIDHVVYLQGVLPLSWSLPEGIKGGLKVTKKIKESDDVTSFELVSNELAFLPHFRAGQHLPIQLALSNEASPIVRTYSLSNSPEDKHYRISVKREKRGNGSRYLHDIIQVGDVIPAQKPSGDFLLKFPTRPVVLISAGIGITPLISMLHSVIYSKVASSIHVFYAARNGKHAPLLEEVRTLHKQHDSMTLDVVFSQANEEDVVGEHYDRKGRVSAKLIQQVVPDLLADFYLCGPTGFLTEVISGLDALGVRKDRIHFESF